MKNNYKVLLVGVILILAIAWVFFYRIEEPSEAPQKNIIDLPREVATSTEYSLISTNTFSPVNLVEGVATSSPYFAATGAPIYFRSDPPSYGEIIKTNASGVYAIEMHVSEPDMTVSLWDLDNKKVYFVAQCGTACGFNDIKWLSDSKFEVYGIERGYGEGENAIPDSQFYNSYDLETMTFSVYSK